MEFKTEDAYLAAYLRTHAVPLLKVRLQPVEDRWLRAIYVFESDDTVRRWIEMYGESITMVNLHNLRSYLEEVRYHARRAAEEYVPDDGPRKLMS